MPAPIIDNRTAKSLADLQEQYRQVDDQVKKEIRTLRTARTSKEGILAWLGKITGNQPRERQR